MGEVVIAGIFSPLQDFAQGSGDLIAMRIQLKKIYLEIIHSKSDQVDVGVPLVGTQLDAMLYLRASAATLKRDAPTSRFWVMEMMILGAIMIRFFLKLIPMGPNLFSDFPDPLRPLSPLQRQFNSLRFRAVVSEKAVR